ncbi:hypothetical protein [Helicobacter sp. 13S00477-4]|uniref:hypothetical protein n=1 Tax=Helicobacter sp. 13S00477-4 TaxID=1905759 RepID=UPI000BA6F298|nr:hypothetical protein [Helicobacter sp. 13S00477-4]PAF51973.1 hypothetical protein BKH44_04755 [Helicobacter sp. 13S00477-4]
MKPSSLNTKILMQDILLQSNTLSDFMINSLNEMFELFVHQGTLEAFYHALFTDIDNINKLKSGVLNMQYIYHYYKKFIQIQIRVLCNLELDRYYNQEPLHYAQIPVIDLMKNTKGFDEYNDVKEYILSCLTSKFAHFIRED